MRATIGRFPAVSVPDARMKALELTKLAMEGINPNAAHREAKGKPHFSAVFQRYVNEYSKLHKRTWKEDQAKYERHLKKPLGSKTMDQIRRADIAKIHADIGLQAPIAANRVMALLSHVFNWAISMDLASINPVKGVKRNRETDRGRFMHEDELARFWTALSAEPDTTIRDFFAASLLTAARRSNVLAMRWDQIDFSAKTWLVPRTKNGDAQLIPLNSQMMELLAQRRLDRADAWVFPGKGASGHLVEPKSAWRSLCKRASLVNFRLHDLRCTNATWQIKSGTSLVDVQKSLGHKTIQATLKYARADLGAVQKSSQRTADSMLLAGTNTAA